MSINTKEQQKIYNKRYYENHKDDVKKRQKEWANNNKDKINEIAKRYRETHREEIRARSKLIHRESKYRPPSVAHIKHITSVRNELRSQILLMFGSVCCRCGFTDVRALQIDHVNGGGTIDRKQSKSVTNYYRNILNSGGKGYQLLCANCNVIKKHEQREVRK